MRRLAAASIAVALASTPGGARAYVRSRADPLVAGQKGACLWWAKRQVPFTLHEAGSRDVAAGVALDAARASFRTWSELGCTDFTFVDRGTTSRTDVGYVTGASDNVDIVLWRNESCATAAPATDGCWQAGDCSNQFHCWDQPSDTIAITTTTFNKRTGQLYDADLELNGDGFVFTTMDSPTCPKGVPVSRPSSCAATDIQNTVTHEAGHMLGLDHNGNPASTMYRSAELGEISKRVLGADDIAGVCAIYPSGQAAATCDMQPDPVADDGCGCATAPGAAEAALAVALLSLALRGVRRRRRSS